MKYILAIAVMMSLSFCSQKQDNQHVRIDWDITLPVNSISFGQGCCIPTENRGITLAGVTGEDYVDFTLLSLNEFGLIDWKYESDVGVGASVKRTASGMVVLAHSRPYTDKYSERSSSLLEFDMDGRLLLNIQLTTPEDQIVEDFVIDNSGSYVMTGWGNGRMLLMKYTNRILEWSKSINFNNYESTSGRSIIVTDENNYVIQGTVRNPGEKRIYVLQVDENGEIIWKNVIKGRRSWDYQSRALIAAPDGGYLLVGDAESISGEKRTPMLFKVSGNGALQWRRMYNNSEFDIEFGVSVALSTDHGYLITGWVTDENYDGKAMYLMKTDSKGKKQWYQEIHDRNESRPYIIVKHNSEDYTIGYSEHFINDTERYPNRIIRSAKMMRVNIR